MKITNYGNWIPAQQISLRFKKAVIMAAVTFMIFFMHPLPFLIQAALAIFLGFLTLYYLFSAIQLAISRSYLSYEGKHQFQNKILDYVVGHIEADHASILDIGCGSGALSIKTALKFPTSTIVAIDYWGQNWQYAQEQCIANAHAEGVAEQITFKKGDAAKLDFDNESFDVVISNLVFHEVQSQSEKEFVVREALRVLKKGGCFIFHDLFLREEFYHNIYSFVEQLKQEYSDVHFIPSAKPIGLPSILKTRTMFGPVALLHGRK